MQYETETVTEAQIFRAIGRIDAHSSAPLLEWLENAVTQSPSTLLVNMSQASFIDTHAISLLVQGMKRSREQDGELMLCSLPQPIRIIFELMRMDRAFKIFEDEAEALASLAAAEA